MYYTMKLANGSELSSGPEAANAILSVSLTWQVNQGTDLTLGSVCAAMAEIALLTPAGGLSLAAGEEFTLYRVEGNASTQVGIFRAEKPVRASANSLKITAYDRAVLLDRDLTSWLSGLTQWPYSLMDLAHMVCAQCGLTLTNQELPNGSYPVRKFSADGITGRGLMEWIGQIAGRFFRITPQGAGEFAWYAPVSVPSGFYWFQNGLNAADYAVAPIGKVQLRQSEEDVGTVYPNTAEPVNTYRITGNYLITAANAQELPPVAQTLYDQLKDITYIPAKLTLPASFSVPAGSILSFADVNGRAVTMYVMKRQLRDQKQILECTGNPRRDSSAAVNSQSFKALSGKVLNLRADVDGIKAENQDTTGRVASLELTVDGLSSQARAQQETAEGMAQSISRLSQSAEGLELSVQSIRDNGVDKVVAENGFTFDKDGLRIQSSGSDISNRLDEMGMAVIRDAGTENETVMLSANASGVVATDVTVRNFLIVPNSRFEAYTDSAGKKRTACFYIGG